VGFFDELLADVKVFTDEFQSIKEELVSTVLDSSSDLRETATEIAGEIDGLKAGASNAINSVIPGAISSATGLITDDIAVIDDTAAGNDSTTEQ
jgi:hypothetical protein